jgi:hypothetical protein
MANLTIIRQYRRNDRLGLVADVSGEYHFQVYSLDEGINEGTTHLVYTCRYSSFEGNDKMGALDHFHLWVERGVF